MTKQKTYNRRKKRKNEYTIQKTRVEKLIKKIWKGFKKNSLSGSPITFKLVGKQKPVNILPGSQVSFDAVLLGITI